VKERKETADGWLIVNRKSEKNKHSTCQPEPNSPTRDSPNKVPYQNFDKSRGREMVGKGKVEREKSLLYFTSFPSPALILCRRPSAWICILLLSIRPSVCRTRVKSFVQFLSWTGLLIPLLCSSLLRPNATNRVYQNTLPSFFHPNLPTPSRSRSTYAVVPPPTQPPSPSSSP
jgi:hypothetical protein